MEAELKEKVEQCLNCKVKPCTKGCPLENNIPAFIEKVKQELMKYDLVPEEWGGDTIFVEISAKQQYVEEFVHIISNVWGNVFAE